MTLQALAQFPSWGGNATFDDQTYAEEVLSKLRQRYSEDKNHPKLKTLQALVERIKTSSLQGGNKEPWRAFVFKDDAYCYASAVRGNYVFIWTGLLNALTEDELGAVLVHVIAHVLAGHTDPDPEIETKRMLLSAAATVGRIASGRSGVGIIATDGLSTIGRAVLHRQSRRKEGYYYYSKRQEQQADELSVRLAKASGLDPKNNLFLFMRAENDRLFAEGIKFFVQHPPYPGRLEKLGRLVENGAQNDAWR